MEIKKEHITSGNLKNVNKELELLKQTLQEDKKKFDKEFINLARSVYKENDKRAYIKKKINHKYNSGLVEEKSYKRY